MSDKYTDPRPYAVLDTECYANYWSIGFKAVDSGKTIIIEKYDGCELDTHRIATVFKNWRCISFNGQNYDIGMILLAMSGATNAELKRASDDIIVAQMKPWEFRDRHELHIPNFIDHIDLMEVSPGSPTKPSQKLYAGRLHSKQMKDLPFEPDSWIMPEHRPVMREYLGIDLDVLRDFFIELRQQIELRAEMSAQYGTDVRSKSDAQVAEAVMKAEIEALTHRRVYKPEIQSGTFNFIPPHWVSFKTDVMKHILARIEKAKFYVTPSGKVEMPADLAKLLANFRIGAANYKAGIGGLHSKEKSTSHYSDDEYILLDRDVASYYPTIILMANMFPKQLGEAFIKVYRGIYERRIKAKKDSQNKKLSKAEAMRFKNIAETLKIVLNGAFGKLGSPFSILYSPNLMIQTTLSGQLAVLMLIEELELLGMAVVSANTDGFITKVPHARRAEFFDVLLEWELKTGFATEETEYKALHSRDVNTYVAFPFDGPHKGKGGFGPSGPGHKGAMGMKKNPDCDISYEAVVAFLKDGTPIEDTIDMCFDIRKFVTVTRVIGGAEQNGEYIGKAVRFYHGKGVTGGIYACKDGRTVASSEGAVVCLILPDELPDDLDKDWYVRESKAILNDIGIAAFDPKLAHRTGTMLAAAPDQKRFHIVRLPSGVAACGKALKSIRQAWNESHGEVPKMVCKACQRAGEL